jgi:protein SOK2
MRVVCVFKSKQKAFVLPDEKVCRAVKLSWKALTETSDNHMINGTKLLNVAGMTRGRRDGILKSEKMRHVVKIGPMHLKGVW